MPETFKSARATLTLRDVSGNLSAVVKSPSGNILFQGFIYRGQYQHLRGLFNRYFSLAKAEAIMNSIIAHYGE